MLSSAVSRVLSAEVTSDGLRRLGPTVRREKAIDIIVIIHSIHDLDEGGDAIFVFTEPDLPLILNIGQLRHGREYSTTPNLRIHHRDLLKE
jgi:hypothetical protein